MQQEEEIILVRGSAEHKDYMRHHFGWLKGIVNGLEDGLSISGRSLLLIFILYTTVKAGMTLAQRDTPWWLDIAMLAFQVCGLEGSIPGLSRLRETLIAKNTPTATEDAETIKRAIHSARLLNMLTGVEILLMAYSSHTFSISGIDINIAEISKFYGYGLLLYRLWKITSFISAMARMEVKKPKIISQAEHEKKQAEAEQVQIRMDNASIQNSIAQAMDAWKQEQARIAPATVDVEELVRKAIEGLQAKVDQSLAAIQHLQNTPATVPTIDNQAIIAGVVGQFETRLTSAMKRLEAEVKQNVLVSLASETSRGGTNGTAITGPRLVPLPQHSVSSRTLKQPAMERETTAQSQGETSESADCKSAVYALLDQDNTRQPADLARETGFPRTTVWRHWNRYHEENGTRGLAGIVAGSTGQKAESETA